MKKIFFALAIAAQIFVLNINAQSKRSIINEGVDLYGNKKYADAEVKFKKGLEKDNKMFQGHFNLGDAYYKQGRYDEAMQAYKNSLQFTKDKSDEAKVYHNIGNSLLKSQKIKESLGAYANSLKLDPNDQDTKYNLSYALNMLKQNQQQKNKNDQNKDKNKDKQNNQNQNQQNNQDQKDKNKDKQNQQQQQQKNQISKQEAQRILDALKNNEADLQKKLRRNKGKPITTEKDW